MSDLLLSESTNDIELVNGDLSLVSGIDAVKQSLKQRMQMFRGEWFLDQESGIPFFQTIFQKTTKPEVIAGILQNEIQTTPGVLELLSFDLKIETTTRELVLDFQCRGTDGVINYTEVLGRVTS